MKKQAEPVRTLGFRDITLFTVSAILLLDTLAAGATVGAASVFWWLFLGLAFFAPYAMICAELGTAYPEQGGLYAWVRQAFGRRWASRTTWAYWVNTAAWIPAIQVLFAGIFSQMFAPDMSLGAQIAMGLALIWIAVAINVVTLDVGKWIPNLGASLKILIIVSIIIGAILHTQANGMANPLNADTLLPSWDQSLKYLPVIVYGMLGFELASAGSGEMKNPARDVPRAIFASGLIVIVMYTSATIAILAAIPAGDIDLVEGLLDTLNLFFAGTAAGNAFVVVLGVGALYTFFSNGVTWALGCNRAMAKAAAEGEFPQALATERRYVGTPSGSAVAMGVVSSTVLLLYGFFAGSKAELFWSLFAFSAVVFLLPYIVLVLAFLRLRQIDPDRPRPYRVPGGKGVARLVTTLCVSLLGLALLLFIYTPGAGLDWAVLIGALVVLASGEITIRLTERSHRADNQDSGLPR